MKKRYLTLLLMILGHSSLALEKADLVIVEKAKSRMYLEREGKIIREFHIALGRHPKGHKQQEGDGRTPEGRYILDTKKADSAFYKSIHISYPNEFDISSAAERGVSPGGAIMIHGQKNGYGKLARVTQRSNWTNGCIAVTDNEMDEIWASIDPGTPIEIRP